MHDINPTTEWTRRFGKSPFWLRLYPEQYAAAGSGSWCATVSYRTPRARKIETELPVADISPRHPLLTLAVGGESFPLLITGCVEGARGAIVLSGARRVMLKAAHTLEWTATVKPQPNRTGAHLRVEFKANISPALPARLNADLRIELFSPMQRPEAWSFSSAPESHRGALDLWGSHSGVSISLVTPGSEEGPEGLLRTADSSTTIRRTLPRVIRHSRGAYTFFIRFDQARSRSHARFMHMRHTAAELPVGVNPLTLAPDVTTLRERALSALHRLTDKTTYDVVGIERVYVRGLGEPDANQSRSTEFYAGFPYFPLDAARAMLDWHVLIGDEVAARLALLIARGIATDFSVISGEATNGLNKGAFWDRRSGHHSGGIASFTDFAGDDFHSIASTARIARGLFGVYERTKDLTSLHAALSACQWLILRQNSAGYYDGDRVCAATGAVIVDEHNLSGIEAVPPMLQAYRATNNEVFVKSAMRIMRHVTSTLMPDLTACPIYRKSHGMRGESPTSVAALIRSLAFVHSEAATRRTREDLDVAGIWLRAWDLTHTQDQNLNHDGHWDGLYEIARAALHMAVTDRGTEWLDTALRLTASMPPEAHQGWQALPMFIETMIALTAFAPKTAPDLHMYKSRIGWTDYAPDSSTNFYISVRSTEDDVPIDYLPLVSTMDHRVLMPILAHGAAERIEITQNGKQPNLRDLLTGEIVSQPAALHKLPFTSPMHWGCFIIEP